MYRSDRERARQVAAVHGVPWVSGDVRDAIEGESDVVVIAAPVYAHAELVERALRRGKSVVCEKPLALDAKAAEAMVRAADAAGVPTMTMFQWRWHPCFRALRDLVASGRLGRMLQADLRFEHDFLADQTTPFPWRHTRAQAGGGALADQGVHLFDLLRWLTGEEYEVRGVASSVLWDVRRSGATSLAGDTEDAGSVLLQSPGGLAATVSVARVTRGCRRMRVTISGTSCVAWAEVWPETGAGQLGSSGADSIRTWPTGSLANPYAGFLARDDAKACSDVPDFTDGLAAQRLLDVATGHSPTVLG